MVRGLVAGETFEIIKKRSGVPDIVFHGLRHTFASHYMLNGGSVWDLMQILGHARQDDSALRPSLT